MTSATQYFQQQVAQADGILYKLRCYRDPQRIRNDVIDLLKNTPSLQPRVGPLGTFVVVKYGDQFVANAPSQNHILYLAGTVPIFYNGAQYNIPVNIWIIEAYPFSPPVVYVTPTPGMIIKPKHRHVDSAGMCYLPYLSNWNPNNCNLVGLVGVISKIFSQDPPVRSSGSASQQPQQQQSNASSQPSQSTSPYPSQYGNSSSPYPYGNSNQQPHPQQQGYPYPQQGQYPQQSQYPQQGQQHPQQGQQYPQQGQQYPQHGQPHPNYPQQGGQPFEDPATVAKRNAVNAATERIQAKLHQFYSSTTKEIDELMLKNSEMEAKIQQLTQEKQRVEMDKQQIDADIDGLTRNFEDITKWLESNDHSNSIDIDAITEPKDSLSKQLLSLVAEEATIEDALYYLEKKMNNGEMDLDSYLKSVRSLTSEQFLKRATIKKIHDRQRQGR